MKITKQQLKQIIKEELETSNLFEDQQEESNVDRLLHYMHKSHSTAIDHPLEQAELIYKLIERYYGGLTPQHQSEIWTLVQQLRTSEKRKREEDEEEESDAYLDPETGMMTTASSRPEGFMEE